MSHYRYIIVTDFVSMHVNKVKLSIFHTHTQKELLLVVESSQDFLSVQNPQLNQSNLTLSL